MSSFVFFFMRTFFKLYFSNYSGQRIYVSVAVGNDRFRTDVFRRNADDKDSPHWNQEFKL